MKAVFYDGISSLAKSVEVTLTESAIQFEYLDPFGYAHHITWLANEITHTNLSGGNDRKINHNSNELAYLEIKDQPVDDLDRWIKTNNIQKQNKSLFISRGFLLGLILFALLILPLSYFVILPAVAQYAATKIPIEYEQELGENLAQSVLKTYDEITWQSAFADSFVTAMGVSHKIPVKIHVIKSDELNAFALPGGHIFIFTALLDSCQTPETLAALLGHEIGHVQLRHSTKAILQSVIGQVLIQIVVSDYSSVTAVAAEQANKLKELGYSRGLEKDADEFSLSLLSKARINRNGLIQLFKTFESQEKEDSHDIPQFLSSHPLTKSRIRHAKKIIAKNTAVVTQNEKLTYYFKRVKKL